MSNIRCKDQSTSSFGGQPWLIKIHGEKKPTCTFINPVNGSIEERNILEMQGKNCVGCFEEWLLLIDNVTRDCFFFSIISHSKVHLPAFPEPPEIYGKFSITSAPTSPDTITTFIPDWGNFVLSCCMHDNKWTKSPIPPQSEEYSISNDVNITYKGRLFLFDPVQSAMVFDLASLVEGRIEMTESYLFHNYPLHVSMNKYLVESCNSLFLVGIHWFGNGQNVINMEVYQLFEPSEEETKDDETGIYWDYVSSIGDRAFFLSRMYGLSLCAKEVGLESNCIYATLPCSDGERLYKFSLEDQTNSFKVLLPEDILNFESEIFWTVPMSGMQAIEPEALSDVDESNKVATNSKEQKDNMHQITRRWADLPTDFGVYLFQKMSLVDSLRFSAVCKSWVSASEHIPTSNPWPWLMHSPNISNGMCKIFDPVNEKEYSVQINALKADGQLIFHSSIDGWVVISEGSDAIFILNPLTEEVIDIPPLDVHRYHCISFIGIPTSPDCRAFAFKFGYDDEEVLIHSWSKGDEEWKTMTAEIDIPFSGTINNPVLYNGDFYCLDRKGQLGVFNPDESTWKVLSKPEPIYSELPAHGHACCALLELHGDLLAVFRTDNTDPIRVFKLDQSKMAWSILDDLGDFTLFAGFRNSLVVPSPLKTCRNSIYLPKFNDRDHMKGVFYSMADHMYHPKFYGTEEPTTYVWFEPSTIVTCKE